MPSWTVLESVLLLPQAALLVLLSASAWTRGISPDPVRLSIGAAVRQNLVNRGKAGGRKVRLFYLQLVKITIVPEFPQRP